MIARAAPAASRRIMAGLGAALMLLPLLLLVGCGARIELYRASDAQSANEIESVLRQRGIGVQRVGGKDGVVLSVADGDFSRAISALHAAGLPRQARARVGDAFGKKGMLPTPAEERARYAQALEQAIESTLLEIDGVVSVRSRVVAQERAAPGAPSIPASASLLIKHRRDVDLSPLVPGIVQLVKNGVPGLAGEDDRRVAVVVVPEQEINAAAVPLAPTDSRGGLFAAATIALILVASAVGACAGWHARTALARINGGRPDGQQHR